MEKWQSEYVRKNLFELISNTDCNAELLSRLTLHLSKDDESLLDATRKSGGKIAQTKLLYDILIQRQGMYEHLAHALYKTKQTKAFLIIIQGLMEQGVSNVFQKCGIDEKEKGLHSLLKGFEKAALSCCILFQGRQMPLQDILHTIGNTTIEQLLAERFVKENMLVDLINNKRPSLVPNSVADPLTYYIPRKLTSRYFLDPAIFQRQCNDVFVVSQILPHQLRLLAKNQSIDMSGNQTERITSRFIVLEYIEDFEKICKISATPVHLIAHDGGRLKSIKSHGDISTLQDFVHHVQDTLNEDDSVKICLESKTSVCVSDSPGMGKTIFLARIARELMEMHPDRLVQYFVLREFVPEVDKLKGEKIGKEMLIDVICRLSSQSEFGQEIIRELLKSENQTVELLFDGFDEVLLSQLPTAKAVLKMLEEMKSIRLFVATRPHMRDELENTLGAIGYNMEPFGKEEQISFLTKYWEQQDAAPGVMLTQFAGHCLEALKTSLNDFEQNFAGIPLQCKLLAEVYKHQALKYSKPDRRLTEYESGAMIRITSIFEIYKKLIDLKIGKTNSSQRKFLLNAHMYASLQLLFPEYAPEFQYMLIRCFEIHPKEMCAVGILERKVIDDPTPRFVHRTFAEYFLGLFIASMLNNKSELYLSCFARNTFLNFLSNNVLRTTLVEEPLLSSLNTKCKPIKSVIFQYPVICYFINSHLKSVTEPSFEAWIADTEKLNEILTACTVQNCEAIYTIVCKPDEHKELLKGECDILDNLHFLSAKHSDLELIKLIQQQLLEFVGKAESFRTSSLPQFIITPLHIAVERGIYLHVQHFLKLHSEFQQLKYLAHCCVSGSINNSKDILSQKTEILRLLFDVEANWVNEPIFENTVPILQFNVSLKLLECLFELRANINAVNQHGCVLHRLLENELSPEKYQDVFLQLCSNGFDQINAVDTKQRTPLHSALEKIELIPETMELFHYFGADFNAVDQHGDSILFYAVRERRSAGLINMLSKVGTSLKHTNTNEENVLHICAKHGNHEAFEHFLLSDEIGMGEVTYQSSSKLTPFMLGLEAGNGQLVRNIKLMEEKGLKITKEIASDGLMALLCNRNYLTWENETEFVHTGDYLLSKGAKLTCRFGKTPWNLEATLRNKEIITQVIKCTDTLLAELKKRGVEELALTYTQNAQTVPKPIMYSENVLDLLKKRGFETGETRRSTGDSISLLRNLEESHKNTFELLCLSLLACNQTKAFLLLKHCLQSDTHDSSMFVTLSKDMLEFVQFKHSQVIVLRSWDVELSIARIKDMVDPDVKIINVISDGEFNSDNSNSPLTVCRCDIATNKILQNLVAKVRKKICIICKQVANDFEGCNVVEDNLSWEDLSRVYQNHLISVNSVLQDKFPKHFYELKNETLVEFINGLEFELITFNAPNDIVTVLSTTIFDYFIPDKLVFYGISRSELENISKYGQKIGEPGDNIERLDYIVINNEQEFEIVRKPDNSPVHLIKHHGGQFQLMASVGSTAEMERFILKNCDNSKVCENGLFCTCSNHPASPEKLIWNILRFPRKQITCWINILDTYPQMNMYDVLNLLENISKLSSNVEIWRIVKCELSLKVGALNPMDIQTILGFNEAQHKSLTHIAIQTIFPEFKRNIEVSGLEKYIETRVLKQCQDNYLVFDCMDLVWYFIMELFTFDEEDVFLDLNGIRNSVLEDCFECQKDKVSVIWWDNTYDSSEEFQTFKFRNTVGFKFLNHITSPSKLHKKRFTTHLRNIATPEFATKWIHASVYGNHYHLLRSIEELDLSWEVSKLEQIILLAVKYADIPIIEMISQLYEHKNNRQLKDIKLVVKWSGDENEVENITMLHVAALRGNYKIMQYLLYQQDFEGEIQKTHMNDLLCFCVVDTYKLENVDERIEIINNLIKLHPDIIHDINKLQFTPLLYPRVHFDLVSLLINLGVNVGATNLVSNNMLHLFPDYMKAEEYDKVVQFVQSNGNDHIFHLLNKHQESPLHNAIGSFDVLDSTLNIFAKARVDFNVLIDNRYTFFTQAIDGRRSARLLSSLFRAGADINKREVVHNMTPLHRAALFGNLTAVRYLTFLGCNVNAIDKDNETPLHLALRYPNKYIYEIVQSLVQKGADVNVIGIKQISLMSYAVKGLISSKISKQTLELLEHSVNSMNIKTNNNSAILITNSGGITVDRIKYKVEMLFFNFETVFETIEPNWDEMTIINFKVGHQTNNEQSRSILSNDIFHFFNSDKFVFINISFNKLKKFARFGQLIWEFCEGVKVFNFDYVIINNEHNFDDIIKLTESNLHLVIHQDGIFKLLRTHGTDSNIRHFIHKTSLCKEFPTCNCTCEDILVSFWFKMKNRDKCLNSCVHISQLRPILRQILHLEDILSVFEVLRLFRSAFKFPYNASIFKLLNNVPGISYDYCSSHLLQELVETPRFCQSNQTRLKHVAVNTLFPILSRNVEIQELEDYVSSNLIGLKNSHLVFVDTAHALAWHLLAELIVDKDRCEFADFRLFGGPAKCLTNCFNSYQLEVWQLMDFISSPTVMKTSYFKNTTLFNSLEHLITKKTNYNNLKTILRQNLTNREISRYIHACVNGNLFNLLQLCVSLLENATIFQSRQIVGLAIKQSSVQVIELVIEQYKKLTNSTIRRPELHFHDPYYVIPTLHVAAIRGDYKVMHYLLHKHAYKNMFGNPKLNNLLHHCVTDTYKLNGLDIHARKLTIKLLIDCHTGLLHAKDRKGRTPLLAPYVHVDLLIYLINLGADACATNMFSNTILHLCANYTTPQEYDTLVRTLWATNNTDGLHSRNIWEQTPLHSAIKYMELKKSTLKIFINSKFDFNAVSEKNNSLLVFAIKYHRSARLLDLLICAGANQQLKSEDGKAVLQIAAKFGNFTAARYLATRM